MNAERYDYRVNNDLPTYVWVITHVNTKELGNDMAEEVGVAGPWGATPEMVEKAKAEGVTFRMRDDDDTWYYRGKLWFPQIEKPTAVEAGEGWRPTHLCQGMGGTEHQEFGPLSDFGEPNAGCVHIDYRCDDPAGNVDGGQPVKVWASL